jgi:hypothetical protein
MKVRDSAMLNENAWQVPYGVDCIINELGYGKRQKEVIAELAAATLPVARRTSSPTYVLEIEPDLDANVDHPLKL